MYSPATASSWSVKEEKVGHCTLAEMMAPSADVALDWTMDWGKEEGSNRSRTRPPLPPAAAIPHPLAVDPVPVALPPDDDPSPLALPTTGVDEDMIEMRELGCGWAGPHTGSKGNFLRESLKAERNLSAGDDDPPPPVELLLPVMVAQLLICMDVDAMGAGARGRAVGGVVGVVMTEEAKSEAADTDVRILPFIPGPC